MGGLFFNRGLWKALDNSEGSLHRALVLVKALGVAPQHSDRWISVNLTSFLMRFARATSIFSREYKKLGRFTSLFHKPVFILQGMAIFMVFSAFFKRADFSPLRRKPCCRPIHPWVYSIFEKLTTFPFFWNRFDTFVLKNRFLKPVWNRFIKPVWLIAKPVFGNRFSSAETGFYIFYTKNAGRLSWCLEKRMKIDWDPSLGT